MKRDARLRGLSSEHHHALVLARGINARLALDGGDHVFAREVAERFVRELEPHFAVEEAVLLPALRHAGAMELVARTEADHARLRRAVAEIGDDDRSQLAVFAEVLIEHVRFEERELFPYCEEKLASSVLDEVARRTKTE